MSQISQMLDTLESQANDQPDLAKKNIQKMVDHVAHEGTRDEFARLVKIAERLGLRGLMNRTGDKSKMSNWHQTAMAELRSAETLLRNLQKRRDELNSAVAKLPNLISRIKRAIETNDDEELDDATEDMAHFDHLRSSFSRGGGKAKFNWVPETSRWNEVLNEALRAVHEGDLERAKRLIKATQAWMFNLDTKFKSERASRTGEKAAFSAVPATVKQSIETMQVYFRMLDRAFVESDEVGVTEVSDKIVARASYLARQAKELVASAKRSGAWSRTGAKAAFSDDSEFVLMLGDGWYYTGRNRQHVRSVSKDVVRFPTRQEAEAVAKSMGNRRHTVVDVPKRGAWANIPIQDLLKHDSSRTGAKAAFASANPIANKVAQLMSEGATRDQAVAFAADARKRGEL